MGISYLNRKAIALFLRGLVRPKLHLHPKPDETILIPSRDAGRTIKGHVYKPASTPKQPGPVLINFYGSGFVLRTFGSEDEYCRFLADNTEYTVISSRAGTPLPIRIRGRRRCRELGLVRPSPVRSE